MIDDQMYFCSMCITLDVYATKMCFIKLKVNENGFLGKLANNFIGVSLSFPSLLPTPLFYLRPPRDQAQVTNEMSLMTSACGLADICLHLKTSIDFRTIGNLLLGVIQEQTENTTLIAIVRPQQTKTPPFLLST